MLKNNWFEHKRIYLNDLTKNNYMKTKIMASLVQKPKFGIRIKYKIFNSFGKPV